MQSFNLPYRYAQRSRGTTRDYIFFAAIDPAEGKMKRKRIYLDHIRENKTRERHAKKLIEHINNLLDVGKNPFVDQENNKKISYEDNNQKKDLCWDQYFFKLQCKADLFFYFASLLIKYILC